MKILANISMFFIPATFSYIVHIRSVYHRGGGKKHKKTLVFLIYFLSINGCTFLLSCARGIGTFCFETMTESYRFKYMGLGLFFGLLFWMVSLLPKFKKKRAGQRNYELDFLKLFFSACVFMSHTDIFLKENTNIILLQRFGSISVFFFFVVSGMLMANSILKKEINTTAYGKYAMMFIINKINMLAWDVYAALFVFMTIYVFTLSSGQISGRIINILPELFFVNMTGIDITYNAPAWYLSAMFLIMLPMAYLLYKNKDFTLYVLAPLLAVFTLGWLCQTHNYWFPHPTRVHGLFLGGVYTAVCALCFGICAYSMYIRLCKENLNENGRMFLTIIEVIFYVVFLGTCLLIRDNRAIMSVILLLPVAVAISFSGKSYIVKLFQFDWMKHFAPISLTIYLNHWIGRVLVQKYFMENSYGFCVFMMAVFTLGSCLLSTCLKKAGRFIWNNKLKTMLFNYE